MVDVVGRLRIQVADRVVAYGRQVHDRVEADEVLALDVAHVLADRLDLGRRRAERARGEEIEVQADEFVAGPLEHRGEHRSDVAVVTSDEYAQGQPPDAFPIQRLGSVDPCATRQFPCRIRADTGALGREFAGPATPIA